MASTLRARMQAGLSGLMSDEYRASIRVRTHSALELRAKLKHQRQRAKHRVESSFQFDRSGSDHVRLCSHNDRVAPATRRLDIFDLFRAPGT